MSDDGRKNGAQARESGGGAGRIEQMGWNLMSGLAAVAAAAVVRKALDAGWRSVVGREPPNDPEAPDIAWTDAVGWALVSGTTIALARIVARRRVAATWMRATGTPPPAARV